MKPWPEQQHIVRFGIMEYVFQWLVWIPLDSCCWFQTSSWHPGSVKVCTLIFVCLCNVYLGNRLCQWSIATRLGGTPHWLLCLNVAAGWIGMMGNRDWAVTCLSCFIAVFFFLIVNWLRRHYVLWPVSCCMTVAAGLDYLMCMYYWPHFIFYQDRVSASNIRPWLELWHL